MSHFHYSRSDQVPIVRALRSLVCLAALMLSTLGRVQARQVAPPIASPAGLGSPGELQTFLDGVIGAQLRDNHIPGATVAVVKDGQLFFAKGYGACQLEAGKAVSPKTSLFQVGSVGKVITAAAVLQLAEQGKVNLHADVNTYLKTFHLPATYPAPITLAHLLTHTAGFEDHITGSDAPTLSDLEPLGQWLATHMPARVRPPGELTAYSNYGFALAGYIVEQVAGLPFAQYVEQALFQPLNMRASTFAQPVPAGLAAELCPSYTYTGSGYQPQPVELLQGAPRGAMSTTATDMAHFMLALLQQGRFGTRRIFQAATAQTLLAQQFTNDPRVPGLTYGFEEHRLNGQRLATKDGYIPAFASLLALLPKHNLGLFVSYNSDGGSLAGNALLQAFLDHYFPAPPASLPPPPPGFAERANQLTGSYALTRRGYTTYEKLLGVANDLTVTKGGHSHLLIAALGHPSWTFVEVTPWVFHRVDGPQTVVFRAAPNETFAFVESDPTAAFVKLPWYDTPSLHLGLLGGCALVFLSALLLWPLSFIRQARRRRPRRKPSSPTTAGGATQPAAQARPAQPARSLQDRLPRLATWLALGLCALNLLFLVGLVLFLSGLGPYPVIFRGVTPLLALLFALALGSAVLTVGIVAGAVLAWRGQFWCAGRRLHYSLVAVAAVAFALELVDWHMLGLRV